MPYTMNAKRQLRAYVGSDLEVRKYQPRRLKWNRLSNSTVTRIAFGFRLVASTEGPKMSYEDFQAASVVHDTKTQGLNLCDVVGYGQLLKHDLTTVGPDMFKEAMKTPPETVMTAAAAAALVTVSVVAGSEVLIGVAGACGVACALSVAGKVAIDHLPKFPSK